MEIITKRADEIVVGDIIDTHCGIGFGAHDKVIAVRTVAKTGQIEITTDSGAISPTILRRPSRPLDVVLY